MPMARWLDEARDADMPVVRNGSQWTTLGQIRRRVCALAATLSPMPARRFALSFHDGGKFLVAFLAMLYAGKTPVIPGNWPLAVMRERHDLFDAVLSDDAQVKASFPLPAPAEHARYSPPDEPLPALDPGRPLELFTSGSTGMPCRITRTVATMERELELFASTLGAGLAGCHVVASVTHQHLYGLDFRMMLPMAMGLTWDAGMIEFPEQLLGIPTTRPLAFVSSPAFLKRLDPGLPSPPVRWVLSAGSALPGSDAQAARRWLGAPVHEVYGSTETGVMAWRTHASADPPWQPFPGVRFEYGADGWRVHSPLVDAPDGHPIADNLQPDATGGFRLTGRRDRIVKIADKRVSLDEIERRLRGLGGVRDARALPLRRRHRISIAAVLTVDPSVLDPASHGGWLALQRRWQEALRAWLDPVAIPRYWRVVASLPTNTMGKQEVIQLQELFRDADGATG